MLEYCYKTTMLEYCYKIDSSSSVYESFKYLKLHVEQIYLFYVTLYYTHT